MHDHSKVTKASALKALQEDATPDYINPNVKKFLIELLQGQPNGQLVLTELQAAYISDIRAEGNVVRKMVDLFAASPDCDQRWVALARTHLQQGFMCLSRSVAKPDFF